MKKPEIKLKANSLLSFGLVEALARGANWFGLVLLGLILPIEQFGYYSIALALVLIASAIAVFGQNRVVLRYCSMQNSEAGSVALLINVLGGVFVCAVVGVVMSLDFLPKPIIENSAAIVAWLFFTSVQTLLCALARAVEDIKLYLGLRLFFTISKLVLLTALAWFLQSFSSLIAAEAALTISVVFWACISGRQYLRVSHIRSQLRTATLFGLPFVFHMLASTALGHIDKLMLAPMVSTAEIAKYSFINSLTSGVYFLFAIVTILYETRIYQSNSRDIGESMLRLWLWVCILGGGAALILVNVIAPVALPLLGRETFVDTTLMAVLSIAYLVYPFAQQANMRFAWHEKPRLVPFITISAAIINVGLNYVLIPTYGIMGAAISTLVAYCVMATLAQALSRRL